MNVCMRGWIDGSRRPMLRWGGGWDFSKGMSLRWFPGGGWACGEPSMQQPINDMSERPPGTWITAGK